MFPASFALAIGIPVIFGSLVAAQIRRFKASYYNNVIQPRFLPPGWVFAPIWTYHYVSMGYASYLVYDAGRIHGVSVISPLTCYAAQLAVNLCCPILLFRQNIRASLFAVAINFLLAIITAYKFHQITSAAAKAMVPYLVWLKTMWYANKATWRLNKSHLIKERTT
ncbi:hypothetical protein DSO57_1036364 [Entomophthora muscae]|uniref:Uncharacterized protein n=1 Tax=Entomophthora muscae TaxID=34485 RepID=A0ACC2S1F1_9FUNG|nr:hypothetical protein DSO57_1036364 [Entomophthora muscae]